VSDIKLLAYVFAGATPTEAIDRYMLEDCGVPASMWAQTRGVSVAAVKRQASECPDAWSE
jgi:hypothetical protein